MLSTLPTSCPPRFAVARPDGALLCRWLPTFDAAVATLRELAYLRYRERIDDDEIAYGIEIWDDKPFVLVLVWCDRAHIGQVSGVLACGDAERVISWWTLLELTGDWMSGHGAPHLVTRAPSERALERAA